MVADEVGNAGSWSAIAGVVTARYSAVQCYLQIEMLSAEFSPVSGVIINRHGRCGKE
ncbi:hypothetical protein HMPREF1144_1720 [Klebsiella sp. OBRC7]|nr:hypothetical protein CSC12_3459 [Klebsiella michiganensis]EJU31320.1 hypothetical protein HMPREF1144_1720 [Klebsiella sp. OBRC7]EUB41648.1 hypothetical protein HMPREF1502_0399 [Klebsiella sp. AS10]